MIGLFGRQGPAATLRQHCPQMTRRRCSLSRDVDELDVGEVAHECAVGGDVAGAAVVLDDLRHGGRTEAGDVALAVDRLGEAGGGGAPEESKDASM